MENSFDLQKVDRFLTVVYAKHGVSQTFQAHLEQPCDVTLIVADQNSTFH